MAEEHLNKLNEDVILESILTSSTDMAIAATDLDFRIMYYNPIAEKLFGYKAEEVIGKTVMEMHTKESVVSSHFERAIETVRKEGEYKYAVEQKKENVTRFIESRVSGIWDRQTNLIGFVLMSRDITENKRAEEELKQISNKWEATFDSINDLVSIHDKDFNIISVNKAFADLLKMQPKEIIGQKCYELIHDKKDPWHVCPHKKTCKNQQAVTEEFFEPNLGKYLQVSTSPIFDEKKEFIASVHIAKDITERKRAEEMLRSLVNSTVGVTGNECFNAIASEMCKYFGVDCAIVGEIVDTEAVEGEKIRALAMMLDGKVVPQYEYTLKESPCENVTKKGYCIYSHNIRKLFPNDRDLIEMNAEGYVGTPICDKAGKTIGVLCAISRNRIKEHKEWKDVINILAFRASAEIIRKRAEEKALYFNHVLERSLNEIYIFNAETLHFIEVNRGARENLGYTMEELRGLTPLDLKPEFPPELFAKLLEPLRAGNQEKVEFTTVHLRKDGTQYPVEVHLQLMTDAIPVFVAIILDITERMKLEEEKQKIHKLESIGILAGGIAHDFNNILAGILNNVYLSKMFIDRESKAYDCLESAKKAVYRATNLTQQFLTFSKGGALLKKTASIIEIIRESAEFVLRGSNVKCEYKVADSLWPVEVDEGQMNQVIHNLILNAVQAMPEGGAIQIIAENYELDSNSGLSLQEGKYVQVVIQDQGVGIERELLQNIFDPYFTTKRWDRAWDFQ